MNSKECKNDFKKQLQGLLENIDDIYWLMERELKKEILQKKEKTEEIDKETNEIFEILSKEQCVRVIKHTLPLRIILLNKIVWRGHGVNSSGNIEFFFSYNNCNDMYSNIMHINEIKKILKIK